MANTSQLASSVQILIREGPALWWDRKARSTQYIWPLSLLSFHYQAGAEQSQHTLIGIFVVVVVVTMHLRPNSRLSYLLHNVWWPYAGQLSLTLDSQCDHKCWLCLWLTRAGPLTGFVAWRRKNADLFHNLVKDYKSRGVNISLFFDQTLSICWLSAKHYGKAGDSNMGKRRDIPAPKDLLV